MRGGEGVVGWNGFVGAEIAAFGLMWLRPWKLGTKLLHFTLLYFTRTLPALLQILALMFAVTSGKVPNVTRSHDRVTRLLEVQVVVRLPRYHSHSARSP
jgi:hypothetical protein